MSFDYRGLINSPDDPTLQLIIELQKKLAKKLKQDQIDLVETDNEDIYSDGQDIDSVVRYHSELYGQKFFNFTTEFLPPFEPDGDQNTIWLRGTSLGNTLPDISGFNNNASIKGDPTLVDGTIDLGYHSHGVKSVAMRLNRPTSTLVNAENLQVPDSTTIQFASMAIGFSIFVRVRFPQSLAQQGGKDPTVFEKIDDSTPNNGIMLLAQSTGKLVFIVKKGGTTTAKETPAATVTTGAVYDIFVTFTVSGSVMKVYVDGVDKTLVNYTGSVDWHITLTNHDLFIGRRGLGTSGGFAYMDFYDFLPYRNRIVNQTEVTNHQTNKWTISAHAFGRTILANYWATYVGSGGEVLGESFTSTSFTTTSFTVA